MLHEKKNLIFVIYFLIGLMGKNTCIYIYINMQNACKFVKKNCIRLLQSLSLLEKGKKKYYKILPHPSIPVRM